MRLLIAVADAVAHAHAQLIVHRDIKPSNLMVTPDGAPKLLDFGIAALLDGDDGDGHDSGLTHQTGRVLTIGYAAPEQITGAPAGVAVDVFSLGVVLYELLTGWLPFTGGNGSRSALEHAVLHTEPRPLLTKPGGASAGAARDRSVNPPADLARARGDLEAIIRKTLRKDPAERYGNVTALADDLRRWLERRPVSARRDNRRHAAALWLRRHALAAGLSAGLVLTLSAGLVASAWQWRRAEAAAGRSERVTAYLSELLASANPDANHGQSPNVLQLLDKSRLELADRFADDPEVRVRLLEMLAGTYNDLNRYDLAAPLADEWVALAAARYGGDDARTVQARLMQSRVNVPTGPWEPVVASLTALQPQVARLFGPQSEQMRDLLLYLANSEIRVGLLDAAERHLAQLRVISERTYPAGSFERDFHRNYVANLYAAQGRAGLALQELRKTESLQNRPPPSMRRFALVLRRNTIAMQIRLGDDDRIAERGQAILQESVQLLGPANALAATVHAELARYHTDRGEFAAAVAEHDWMLASGSSGVQAPVHNAMRASRLLGRCLLRAMPDAALLAEARQLQAELAAGAAAPGSLGAEALIALARCGLLLGDGPLAADAVAALKASPALATNEALAGRAAQVEGEWRRVQGDLSASKQLLALRVAQLARSPDRAVPALWAARIDLACTLVLLRDPEAAAALQAAAADRPPQMPAGHPLDAVQAYLQALSSDPGGSGASPAVAAARRAVEAAYGRRPGPAADAAPAPALALAGMFG